MKSKEIKKFLAGRTGLPARDFYRWSKYKVGSPADKTARDQPGGDPGRGGRFYLSHPHLSDCVVRVFGVAEPDRVIAAYAVFERDNAIVHVEDVTTYEWKSDL